MRTRTVVATLAGCLSLCACEGLKDALSAHADVVARTVGGQELTVTQLGGLFGNAKIPVQITKENVAKLTSIWSDYHRLAYAAAHSDTLMDHADAAVAPIIANQRVAMYMDTLMMKIHVDSATEVLYNAGAGGLYDARHILFAYPPAATPQQKDSVKKVAAAIRPQITAENFPAMAKKYSKDAQTAPDSGNLGVFPKSGNGAMVPEFSNATVALKPGEISGLVESTYGIHIIQRLNWAQAKQQYSQAYAQVSMSSADSTIVANMSKAADVQVKKDVAASVRSAMKDLPSHRTDHSVLVTFNKGGKFTVADFIMWFDLIPPPQHEQVLQGLPQAPDSVVSNFTKNMALRLVLLRSADSAKIDVPADQKERLRTQIRSIIVESWRQLGVAPEQLADSAKSQSDKERLASKRVDGYIDRFMAGEEQPSLPPPPLEQVLDSKYATRVNAAGLDRAVAQGEKMKSAADSARAGSESPSAIPMPQGAGQAPSAAPPPASKAPATKAPSKKPPLSP